MAAVDAAIYDLSSFDPDSGGDGLEAKLRRASERSKTLRRKRAQFERSKARPMGLVRGVDLRGAVRAASRTCLSRCSVESGADLPRISKAEMNSNRGALPASVTPMLRPEWSPGGFDLVAPEHLLEDLTSEEPHLGWGPLAWHEAAERLAWRAAKLAGEPEESRSTAAASDSEGAMAELAELAEDQNEGSSSTDGDDQHEAPLEEPAGPQEAEAEDSEADEDDQDQAPLEETRNVTEQRKPSCEAIAAAEAARREAVLRQIVSHLQGQVTEANRTAAQALAQARETEQQAEEETRRLAEQKARALQERAAEERRANEEQQARLAREAQEKARDLREAKALEQARARSARKEADRERRRQQEVEALRARETESAERAATDARAAQAAQAAEERRRTLAAAMAAAQEEARAARAAAEEDARAIRAAAEEEANAIKARAEAAFEAMQRWRAADAPTEPQDIDADWEVVGETREADDEGWDLA